MSLTSTVIDLATTTHPNADVLAATDVNTKGLRGWIKDNIIFTILAVIACVILIGGLRANLSKVFTVGGLTLVGLAFLGISQNEAAATGIGSWLLGLIGIQV